MDRLTHSLMVYIVCRFRSVTEKTYNLLLKDKDINIWPWTSVFVLLILTYKQLYTETVCCWYILKPHVIDTMLKQCTVGTCWNYVLLVPYQNSTLLVPCWNSTLLVPCWKQHSVGVCWNSTRLVCAERVYCWYHAETAHCWYMLKTALCWCVLK